MVKKFQFFLASSFLGLLLAIFVSGPLLQWVYLDTAQILAGVVHYKPTDIEYILATRLRMLPPVFFSWLLRAGVGDAAVSLLILAAGGAAFMAGFLLVLRKVLNRNELLFLLPVSILYFLSGVHLYELSYPMMPFGSANPSGQYGFAGAICILGLIASGRARAALLGTAALFLVHGMWAMFCVGVFGLSAALDRRDFQARIGPWSWNDRLLAAGACAVVVYFYASAPHSAVPYENARFHHMMRSYLTDWDDHRQPLEHWDYGWLILAALPLPLIARNWKSSIRRPGDGDAWLRRCLVTALAAPLALALLSHWNSRLPLPVVMIIPGRFINFPMVILPLIVLFFSKRIYAGLPESALNGVFLVFLLLYAAVSLCFPAASAALRAVYLAYIFASLSGADFCGRAIARVGGAFAAVASAAGSGRAVRIALAALLSCLWIATHYTFQRYDRRMADSQNDPFYGALSRRRGYLLAAGGINFAQDRTRRPVVFNPAILDQIPYVPETIFLYEPVLKSVYGYSFNERLKEQDRGLGAVPESHRGLWEKRTPAEWAELADKYDFDDILVRADWSLRLHRVLDNGEFAVYAAR